MKALIKFLFIVLLFTISFSDSFYIIRKNDTLSFSDSVLFSPKYVSITYSLAASGYIDSFDINYLVHNSAIDFYTKDSLFAKVILGKPRPSDSLILLLCDFVPYFLIHPLSTETKTPLKGVSKIIILLLLPILYVFLLIILNKISKKLIKNAIYQEGKRIRGVKIGKYIILSQRDELRLIIATINILKYIVDIILFYLMLLYIFYSFPTTINIAKKTFEITLTVLRKGGIFILEFIGFVLVGLIFWIICKFLLKLVDAISSHYEKAKEKSKIELATIRQIKNFVKIVVIILFVLGYISIIPGHTEYISLTIFILLFVVFTLSFLPIARNLILGYIIMSRKALAEGQKIYYDDSWWVILDVKPLYIRIKRPGKEVYATLFYSKLAEQGIVVEKSDEISS